MVQQLFYLLSYFPGSSDTIPEVCNCVCVRARVRAFAWQNAGSRVTAVEG